MKAFDVQHKFKNGIDIWAKHRLPSDPWGRFGGGWNWKLGFMAGDTTIILHLLVMYVGISWYRRTKK